MENRFLLILPTLLLTAAPLLASGPRGIDLAESEPNDTQATGDVVVPSDGAATVSASLTSTIVAPTTRSISQTELNDSIGAATATGITGASNDAVLVSGTVGNGLYGNTAGDFDFFSFTAPARSEVVIDVTTPNPGGAGNLDPVAAIYDSSGNLVAVDDDESGALKDSLIAWTPTSAGTYCAAIGGFRAWEGTPAEILPVDATLEGTGPGKGSTGTYSLRISVRRRTTTVAQSESNDTIATADPTGLTAGQAGEVVLTGTVGDGTFAQEGDFDFYAIPAAAGQFLIIDVSTPQTADFTEELDPVVGLYNAAGTLVASNDDEDPDEDNLDSLLGVPLTAAGPYYLAIGSYAGSSVPDDLPSDPTTGGTAPVPQTSGTYAIAVKLAAADVDFFLVDLAAGNRLTATATAPCGMLQLFDASGSLVTGSGSAAATGAGIVRTAASTGRHALLAADRYAAGATGAYTLDLQVATGGDEWMIR